MRKSSVPKGNSLVNNSLSEAQKEQVFSNLKHKRVYKRIQAVRQLAHIADERVIPSLIERLSDAGSSGPNRQERVCDVAAEVLEQLNVPVANEAVDNWRTDPFPFFRKALDWYDDQYEIPALRELSKLDGDRVIEALMYAMGGYSQNAFGIARDEIIRRGNGAIPRLVQYLDDNNAFRRWVAAYLLGRIGNPIVVSELITALNDPEPKVRCEAAQALGELGDARAVKALRRNLSDQTQCFPGSFIKRVCDHAAEKLKRIGTPEAVQAVQKWLSMGATANLIKALQSGKSLTMWDAVWSAGQLKVKEAVEPLLDVLNNDNPEIKRGAIWSLGVLRDPRAISHLLPYTNDENHLIASSAREALRKLGHSPDKGNN